MRLRISHRLAGCRRRVAVALFLAGILALTAMACGGRGADSEGAPGLRVVATTPQIAALARDVAGDRAQVRSILPPGADAHQFEPSAGELRALADADVILRHGIGLDAWLDDAIGGGGGGVFTVTQGIPLEKPALAAAAGGTGDGTNEGTSQYDPHVWQDPERAKMMVDNIRDALIQADPQGQAEYERNAAAYNRVLDQTDAQIRQIIGEVPPQNRKLVTNHDAFGYFARRYGLQVVGAVIPSSSTEAEPSAKATAALLEVIEKQGVKAIFAESSVNPELARQLARDAGVTIVDDLYGDSLGTAGSGADTVHGMLLANARRIADALR